MVDVKAMFERQARWQRSRATLSWTEKLRMAEILREAAIAMGTRQKSAKLRQEQKARGYREVEENKGI